MEGAQYKPKSIQLKLPEDVYISLLKLQAKKKMERGCQFSLANTIFSCIRQVARESGTEDA